MHYRYSVLAARLLADPAKFHREFACPLLMWAVESSTRTWQLQWLTDRGTGDPRPSARDPVLFEVKKGDKPSNAFALGVTLGRTPNNDVVIDDPTVSRFHAYFQQDLHTKTWLLVDADSHNGTLLGLVRLTPKRPVPMFERAELKLGDVPLTYFSARGFEDHVKHQSAERISKPPIAPRERTA
jgi:hypothetical protein